MKKETKYNLATIATFAALGAAGIGGFVYMLDKDVESTTFKNARGEYIQAKAEKDIVVSLAGKRYKLAAVKAQEGDCLIAMVERNLGKDISSHDGIIAAVKQANGFSPSQRNPTIYVGRAYLIPTLISSEVR